MLYCLIKLSDKT